MNNYTVMSASFEARKNSQATMITAGFAGLMLLLMFLVRWTIPEIHMPIADEGIEVNIGSGDMGFGNDQPLIPGDPAPTKSIATSVPQQEKSDIKDAKDIEEDENREAVAVLKPKVSKPDSKEINKETRQTVKATKPQAVVVPKPEKPKAVLNRTVGGTGTGGNGADSYQKGSNEGIAGGKGDQGVPGGSPNATTYTGNPGNGHGGPRRISGNRTVINPKSMDAGENLRGKVLAEITVSPDGIGTFVRATRGSTYTGGQAIDIIREWLRRNRFNKTTDASTVVYEFNFLLGG
ncbi:MAG: hypothetical protein JST10_11645 [Bacteroidetes bacterium]|nr:hypothetical protein [Bacteroidota bacterium]MBS1633212.1 hypothetical protein [Bacteroidota bacterium]